MKKAVCLAIATLIQSRTIATVRQGDILRKVGEQKGWMKVILGSCEIGWIYGELVE